MKELLQALRRSLIWTAAIFLEIIVPLLSILAGIGIGTLIYLKWLSPLLERYLQTLM